MEINDFLGIMVVGAILSVVIDMVKAKYETNSNATKLITIVLAIVVGAAYVWLRSTPWFATTIMVLTAASTVYAFFLKK